MVAEQLGRRLHDQLRAHPTLFAEGGGGGAAAGGAASFSRPVLVVTERAADLSVRTQHCARTPTLTLTAREPQP